jgi:PPM family protein phosphatase
MKKTMYNTITVTASETNKSENQDGKGEFEVDSSNYVFVTDGLNSSVYSPEDSQNIVNSFHRSIARLAPQDIKFLHSCLNKFYNKAKQGSVRFDKKEQAEKTLATTSILVTEIEDRIIIAYTGNGAVWHIKGNFNSLPDSFLFPWNAFHLLNQYKFSGKAGRNQYQSGLNNDNDEENSPSIIEIQKDKQYGDIILICTDGIYSTNHLKGKNEKGIWIRKNKIFILKIFSYLNHFFHSGKSQDKDTLKEILKLYLQELKPFLVDDATIGVLITSDAIGWQNKANVETT